MKHQGQCLVGLTFLGHWESPCPSKGCGIDLGILIPTLGGRASDQRVREHGMGHTLIAKHSVIGRKSTRERGVNTRSNTALGRL